MKNKEIIELIQADGSIKEAEVLLYFKLNETEKDYIIYTFNEIDEQNLATISCCVVEEENGEAVLNSVSDEDWPLVKNVLKEILQNNKE